MRLLHVSLTLAVLSFSVAACGSDSAGNDSTAQATAGVPATTQTTKRATKRPTGNGVSKSRLMNKIGSDPEFKGLPQIFQSCMADVMLKYSNKTHLRAYVSGSIKLDQVKQLDKKKSEAAGWKCTKLVSRSR